MTSQHDECSTWNMFHAGAGQSPAKPTTISPPGGIPGLQHGSHLRAGRGSSSRAMGVGLPGNPIDIDYRSTITTGYVCHGGHIRPVVVPPQWQRGRKTMRGMAPRWHNGSHPGSTWGGHIRPAEVPTAVAPPLIAWAPINRGPGGSGSYPLPSTP